MNENRKEPIGHYECVNENGESMYNGSSCKTLDKLEWNHRNYYKFKDGYASDFRKALREQGANWTFRWIQEPRMITRCQGEIEEGVFIRMNRPLYNKDMYPYETSVRRGRMEQV